MKWSCAPLCTLRLAILGQPLPMAPNRIDIFYYIGWVGLEQGDFGNKSLTPRREDAKNQNPQITQIPPIQNSSSRQVAKAQRTKFIDAMNRIYRIGSHIKYQNVNITLRQAQGPDKAKIKDGQRRFG